MSSRVKVLIGVFMIVFPVYVLVAGGHYGGDALNSYLTTESMITDQDLVIYDKPFEVEEIKLGGALGVTGPDGKQYSPFGLGMALLQVPLYLVGLAVSFVLKGLPKDYITFFMVSFTNTFLSCFGVLLLISLLRQMGVKLKEALILGLVYAFCTAVIVYSKTGFPEMALLTFMLASIVSLFKFTKEEGGVLWLVASGASLGMMCLVKIYAVILVPLFIVYSVVSSGERRKYLWVFLLAFLGVFSVELVTNYIRSGNMFLTGYGNPTAIVSPRNNFIKALYYYWFSSGKGFFFYNLPLVLGLFCWKDIYSERKKEFFFILSIILIYVVFFAYLFKRGSIFSWGPRYMMPIAPLFMVTASGLFKNRVSLWSFAVLSVGGFLVQLPAAVMHFSSYINFVVEKLNMPEYAINFIPDLSPIRGLWWMFASHISSVFTGSGINFVFSPDIIFITPVQAAFEGYIKVDLWWITLLKEYPGMKLAVVASFILLFFVFVRGIFMIMPALREKTNEN